MKKINEIQIRGGINQNGQFSHSILRCEDCTPKGCVPFNTFSTVDSLNGRHRCDRCLFAPIEEV